MALFQKLFLKRNKSLLKCKGNVADNKKSTSFNKNHIRVISFRDHDLKGRSLLFDSQSVQRLPCETSKSNNTGELRFSSLRAASDTKIVGEMMFGSDAMIYKGSSLKVHLIRSPPQLMVTRVFIPSRPANNGEPESFDSFSVQSSTTEERLSAEKESCANSVPLDVPGSPDITQIPSLEPTEDSGISGSLTSSYNSSYSMVSMYQSPASSTDSSIARRMKRNQITSLEYCVNQRAASGSSDFTGSIPAKKRPSKFGLAIVFSLPTEQDKYKHFLDFFFSHITLVENHIHRLKAHLERALLSKSRFNGMLCEAVDQIRDSIWDLYSTQRLSSPIWLSMMSTPDKRNNLCRLFINNFMNVVDKFESKVSKNFISTLVTGILTNHLAWVPTVMPAGATQSRSYLDKHSAKWLDMLAVSHPYNPLWAQLSDLYGAIGFPLRVSRIIVTGKRTEQASQLLSVLSYFIRCSEVCENHELLEAAEKYLTPESGTDVLTSSTEPVFLSLKTSHAKVLERLPSDGSKRLLIQKMFQSTQNNPVSPDEDPFLASCIGSPNPDPFDAAGNKTDQINNDQNMTNDLKEDDDNEKDQNLAVPSQEDVNVDDANDNKNECDNSEALNDDVFKGNSEVAAKRPSKLSIIPQCEVFRDSLPQNKLENTNPQSTTNADKLESNTEQKNDAEQLDEVDGFCGKKPVCSLSDVDPTDVYKTERVLPLGKAVMDMNINDHNVSSCSKFPDTPELVSSCDTIADLMDTSQFDSYYDGNIPVGHPKYMRLESTNSSILENASLPEPMMLDLKEDVTNTNELEMFDEYYNSEVHLPDEHSTTEGSGIHLESSPMVDRRGPGRSRITRTRHLSTTSTAVDNLENYTEVPMPCFELRSGDDKVVPYQRNFGRSLFAGFSEHYLSDFVLHATNDNNIVNRLHMDLSISVQHSVLDEKISEAVCLVADLDKLTVRAHTCQYSTSDRVKPTELHCSQLVNSIINSVHQLCKLKVQPEFCVMHLEDRLQEIYFKSKMLAEYIYEQKKINKDEIIAKLGIDASDIPLLLAVAGTHSPQHNMGYL